MNAGRQLFSVYSFLPVSLLYLMSIPCCIVHPQPFPLSPDMAAKTHEGITRTILSQAQTIVHDVYVSFVHKD